MKYSELVRQAILKSGYSLSQVAKSLKESGISADKGYLSKLQNDSKPPASDKFNDALAIVLNIDQVELKAAAYREKIPADVLDHLIKTA
ncbi:XRE family transcriptional regulator [Paenibacillus sp. NRS-1760]|uniref:XRE family transcriptional regulator n=1 Tax=Paenibacillus sp. NRS-1760 TaxID=3233902 RepID=UPI003D29EEFD